MTTAVRTAPGLHLSSLAHLRRHCADSGKARGYSRLLADYGVDVTAFSGLVEHPRLVYAEQPGCWYYAEDLMRARLLQALIDTGEFAPSSGVLSLSLDAFSDRGVKRWFNIFTLGNPATEVYLLGASYRRRYRHCVYAALPIDGHARRRLSTLFTTAADMLEAARISPEVFADHLIARFQAGIEPGLRPILPPVGDRAGLMRFAESLRKYRLDKALGQLASPCCELRSGADWAQFWNRVNTEFFGQKIDPLDTLYNQFLLTVSDPVRMACTLRHDLRTLCGHDDNRDVAVAAVITEHDKYRMVHFDADSERFYYCDGDEVRHPISWDELRRQAEDCRTGGPSGVLAYLMMAAAGIYLVSDIVDGRSPFESAARTIHRERLGLRFPSLAPGQCSPIACGGFLQIFTEEFDRCCDRAIDRFLA